MRYLFLLLTVVLLATSNTLADSPCGCRSHPGRHAAPRYKSLPPRYSGDHHYDPYRSYAELYPKYYGGFHSRHLNNLGVPPGDIGLRGNGIYWLPW